MREEQQLGEMDRQAEKLANNMGTKDRDVQAVFHVKMT